MATIILSNDVVDFATWKANYDADSSRWKGAGLKELSLGSQAGNQNKLFMVWEGNAEVVDKMLQDPDLAEKMKEAGVVSKPELTIINS